MSTQFKASAPGSLMLLGEYAVLQGKQALVCAIDKRITITLTPRKDNKIRINSALYGQYISQLNSVELVKPFDYVLGVLKHYHARIRKGCDIDIHSEFSDQMGLGSSAAIIAATLSAVVHWLGMHIAPLDLVREGKSIIKLIQGVGSGADVAASIFGGMVAYQTQPLFAEKISGTYPLVALYSGMKTKTTDAIQIVKNRFAAYPALLNSLYNVIGLCAIEGVKAARHSEWNKLGDMMERQQGMMESLGVSLPIMRNLIEDLRSHSSILGVKISGSGLGDCVIGLGSLIQNKPFSYAESKIAFVPVEMTLQGVHCEKI